MPNYYEFRCKQCDKLLGRVTSDTEIVCPRCGGKNELAFATKAIKYTPKIKKPQNSQYDNYKAQLDRVSKRTSSGTTFR